MDLDSKSKVCFLKVCSDLVKNAYIKSYGYFDKLNPNSSSAGLSQSLFLISPTPPPTPTRTSTKPNLDPAYQAYQAHIKPLVKCQPSKARPELVPAQPQLVVFICYLICFCHAHHTSVSMDILRLYRKILSKYCVKYQYMTTIENLTRRKLYRKANSMQDNFLEDEFTGR